MTRFAITSCLVGLLLAAASPLSAQLAELQFGVRGTYAAGEAFGPGGGLTFAVAPGRVSYVGLSWTYFVGSTKLIEQSSSSSVRNRAQSFTADFGVMIPAGPLDVIAGTSIGALRFSQRVEQSSIHKTEFLVAPTIAAEVHARPFAFIPELQYRFVGDPEMTPPVTQNGLGFALKVVVPTELKRIRR